MNEKAFFRIMDRPIAFHRCFVDLTGSVTAALFLSQAVDWQHWLPKDPGGWWYKTRSEWTEETGLSCREQETAKKKLKKAGLLREEKRGMPPKMWYRVHPAILKGLLLEVKEDLETWKPGNKKATDSGLAIEEIDWAKVLSRPIAFHRRFVDIAGSVNAALVLSQAFYWQHRVIEDYGGWWYKTRTQWIEETGLSRHEQENARKQLSEAGVLLEERRGMPAKIWYRLDPAVLRDLLTGVDRNPVDNPPRTDDPGRSEARKISVTDKTDHLDCSIPPAGPENAPEAREISITDKTDQQEHSWSVLSVTDGQFCRYLYKETEITTETTLPPPQTPPPNESIGGRGGGESKPNTGHPALAESERGASRSEKVVRVQEGLIFPTELSGPERQASRNLLSRCDTGRQEILDVLQAIIDAGEVRKSPLAVLRGLVLRWESGTFDASPGLHLAVRRQRRAEIQARIAASTPATNPARPTPKSRGIPPETLEVFRRLRKSAGRI